MTAPLPSAHNAAPSPQPLHDLLSKDVLKECVRCGLCLDHCPTYRLLGHEADSPRGRIYQVRGVYEGRISSDDPDFREHIYACLDCRACQTACPSGVHYGTIIEAARAVTEPPDPAERKIGRAVLGTVFTRKPLLEALGLGLRLYQRTGAQALVRRTGLLSRLLPSRLAEMEAMLGPIQGGVAHWSPPPVARPSGPVRARVGLITGCVMEQLFSQTNAATFRVLLRNGCEVVSPVAQGCCGALHMHTGDRATAQALARANVDAFEPLQLDAIVINAAGCGSTLKEYGALLADDPLYADRARAFARRVKDVAELLAEMGIEPPTHSVPLRVTYQDACHLVHGQGIRQQPRALLRQIPGLELVEMEESDVCCGSAGIYNLTHPDLSSRLLDEKMAHLAATGVSAVVASNPGCAMQLAYGAARQGRTLRVYHLVDLLDRAYADSDSGSIPDYGAPQGDPVRAST